MANYGDVALNLPPDWSRERLLNKRPNHMTIGHTAGRSDVALKDDPEARHAFAWCAVGPQFIDELDARKSDGFSFVNKNDWDSVYYEWDAEGYLVAQNQRLMAIPEAKYIELRAAEREELERTSVNTANEEALGLADRVSGITLTNRDGEALNRKRKGRR